MSEELFVCKCGFKCVEGQLAKSDGFCPKCGNGQPDKVSKYDSTKLVKRGQ